MKAKFIKRGNLYGGIENGEVIVRAGSYKPYPVSDTITYFPAEMLPEIIALLTALKNEK